jgi:hypothetical protein
MRRNEENKRRKDIEAYQFDFHKKYIKKSKGRK